MKTNHSVRGIGRIRVIGMCVAVAGPAAGELRLGESLASRFGQVNACQSQNPTAPSVGIADLMGAAR